MKVRGISWSIWFISHARRLMFKIILVLVNIIVLWIKYLVCKRVIIEGFYLFSWEELGSLLYCFSWSCECCHFMFTLYLSCEPFLIGFIYVIENCTKRLNNYFYVCCLMWMEVNLNVLVKFDRSFMLFIMFLGAGCSILPQAWPLRTSTYNRCIIFYNCAFVSFCIRFVLADRKLCLNLFLLKW